MEKERQAKSSKLRVLATECLKTFEAAGLRNSEDLQVRKATDLCLMYAPQLKHKTFNRDMSHQMTQVQTQQQQQSNLYTECQKPAAQSLAESNLGGKLVYTVTEKKRQPPDVSDTIYTPYCAIHTYTHLVVHLFVFLPTVYVQEVFLRIFID